MNERRPGALVFVLSGPTGAGKTALMQRLREEEPEVHYCVTATTRPPRPGERNGVDYYFCAEQEFLRLESQGELLEWARIPPPNGPFYGTPVMQIRTALAEGQDVFLQVDVQGARSVRSRIPNAVAVFLRPPDLETLNRRLHLRATEDPAEKERRLRNARAELARQPEFDYTVVNADGRLEDAVARVREIMRVERDREEPRYAVLGAARGS